MKVKLEKNKYNEMKGRCKVQMNERDNNESYE